MSTVTQTALVRAFAPPTLRQPLCYEEMNEELVRTADVVETCLHRCTNDLPPRVAMANEVIQKLSDAMTPENVTECKRFIRHSVWFLRLAVTNDGEMLATPELKKAVGDLRTASLDGSWAREMRSHPSQRFTTEARPRTSDIPNFDYVHENFLRGGQPDCDGVDWLRSQGVQATIDLRGDDRDNQWFPPAWENLKRFKIDVGDFKAPTFEQVNQFIELVDNPENQPVYVHCKAGIGRTGVMTACWRIAHGATADEALAAEAIHSHHGCLAQEEFVRDYEKHLKGELEAEPAKPEGPPREPEDPWPMLEAYWRVVNGEPASEAIANARIADPDDFESVHELAALWNRG